MPSVGDSKHASLEGIHVRRSEMNDLEFILQLINRHSQVKIVENTEGDQKQTPNQQLSVTLQKRFGSCNIDSFLAHSALSVTLTNADESSILAYAAFQHAPARDLKPISEQTDRDREINAIPMRTRWDTVLRSQYDYQNIDLHNTLFLAFLVIDPSISDQAYILNQILSAAYCNVPTANHIFVLLPESVPLFPPLSAASERQIRSENAMKNKDILDDVDTNIRRFYYFREVTAFTSGLSYILYVNERKDILPALKIRAATVEDCDDLIPIFKRQGEEMERKFNDFYLSKLIEDTSGNTKSYVALSEGTVVGFICVDRQVDLQLLKYFYDTAYFEEGQTYFYINLFCVDQPFISQSSELLKAAFEAFKDCNNCLISLPNEAEVMPLTQFFQRVSVKEFKYSPQTVYILNRMAFFQPVSIKVVDQNDSTQILEYAQSKETGQNLISHLKKFASRDYNAFEIPVLIQFESNGSVIGFSLINTFTMDNQESQYHPMELYRHFDVQDSTIVVDSSSPNQGRLRYFHVEKLYRSQVKWILQEICRQLGMAAIYYALEKEFEDTSTIEIVRSVFFPLNLRKQIVFPENLNDGVLVKPPPTFNVRLFAVTHLYEPKIDVNHHIVIVGASEVGLSLAEQLLYTKHLHLSNITLVSTSGIPFVEDDDPTPYSGAFNSLRLKQLGLGNLMRVVQGRVVEIDRSKKLVRLSDSQIIKYDILALTPGMQYLVPLQLPQIKGVLPNIFTTHHDDYPQLFTAMKRAATLNINVVIFGRDLQAYSTVRQLLHVGVNPHNLYLVQPPRTQTSTCFNDPRVDSKVDHVLDIINIQNYDQYELTDIVLSGNNVQSVTIMNEENKRTVPCGLLIYSHTKVVTNDTFLTLNDSCLVFDGRLVIDDQFRTNDPNIFAAGTVTRFSHRHPTKWLQEHFSSKEVGQKLATHLMTKFDPLRQGETVSASTDFFSAKIVSVRLPGGYYYLHFDQPRVPGKSYEEFSNEPTYGRDLVTFNDNSDVDSYFRINLDPQSFIRSLTYFGKEAIPVQNYLSLYGLHEKYLNRLVSRYDEGIIPDFVSFLQETWALPLYFDKFLDFRMKWRRIMLQDHQDDDEETSEAWRIALRDLLNNPSKQPGSLFDAFQNSKSRPIFADAVVQYLGDI